MCEAGKVNRLGCIPLERPLALALGLVVRLVGQGAREPKVGDFARGLVLDENVARSQIAVHKLDAFQIRHAIGNLQHKRVQRLLVQSRIGAQVAAQRA